MLHDNTLLDDKQVTIRFKANRSVSADVIGVLSKKFNNQDFFEAWLLRELKFEANLRKRFAEMEEEVLARAQSRLKKAIHYSEDDISYIAYTDTDALLKTLVREMVALYLLGGQKAFAEFNVGYEFGFVDQSIVGFDIANIPAAADNLTAALQEAMGAGLIDERTIASRAAKIANLVKNNYDPRLREAIVETMKQRLGPDGLYTKIKQVFKDGYLVKVPAKYDEAGKLVRREYQYTMSNSTYAATVARTESIRWANEGKLDGYEQLGVVEKVILFTALDEAVCVVCSSLHGKVFAVQDARGVIPIHARCRCVWMPYVDDFLKKSITVPEDVQISQNAIDRANFNIDELYAKPSNVLSIFGISGKFPIVKTPNFPKIKKMQDVIENADDIVRSVAAMIGNRITSEYPVVHFVMNNDEFDKYVKGYIGNKEGNGFYIPDKDWIIINAGAFDKWEGLFSELIWQFIFSYQKYGQKNPNLNKTLSLGFNSFLTYSICRLTNGEGFKRGKFYFHARSILDVLSDDKFRKFYIANRVVTVRGAGNKTKKLLTALLSYLDIDRVSGKFGSKNPNIIIPDMIEMLKHDFENDDTKFIEMIEKSKKLS